MLENISKNKSRRPVWIILLLVGVALGALIGLALSGRLGDKASEPAPAAAAITPSPQPSVGNVPADAGSTPAPTCAGDEVAAGLETILTALERGDVSQAQAELEMALSAYSGLMEETACGPLAQELLAVQALVAASAAWEAALESGSARQVEEAARLAALADELAPAGAAESLAAGLVAAIEGRSALLAEAIDLGRDITHPETITTEIAGGLHPLCEVNTVIKPLLADQSGAPVPPIRRIEVFSDTLYVLAGGRLLMADLERVHGPSPAVFLRPVAPDDGAVAGAQVDELVDLARAAGGDLLLLEKSGRVLRRMLAGDWSLERPAQPEEMPVAIAPFSSRFYLLDPAANQVWRYPAEAEGYLATYFVGDVIRNVSRGVDLAVDGAIYVARYDGRVRRYYVGAEDPNFRPDTGLGTPAAIFLPDETDSTLVYVVDGPGRRLLGLDRETGAYRLGFTINLEEVDPLTSGAIHSGRLYLTDGKALFITILTPTPSPAVDCPAFPFPPSAPFHLPQLAAMDLQSPVSSALPGAPSHYPGGRWPQLGYGVLEGLAFTGLPLSDTVRAIASGTISRILLDAPPLLETDLAVITATGRVPSELYDAVWGNQVWIDHGEGIETRYGGLAAVLPSLAEGQTVRRLTIIGFAGEEPVFLGLWVDGQYVGYGRSVPETIVGYHALFEE